MQPVTAESSTKQSWVKVVVQPQSTKIIDRNDDILDPEHSVGAFIWFQESCDF